MEITLDQLLASRDKRHERQQKLLAEFSSATLLSMTVVMPGKVKRNHTSLIIAHAATECLFNALAEVDILHHEEHNLPTGYEAYFIVKADEVDIKRIVCNIENTHPLGRLFDIDVIRHDGTPLSRKDIGLPPRRCLMCHHEARYCMRNQTHSVDDINRTIAHLVESYVQANDGTAKS